MSYNASIPVATTSPSVFPAQCQTNWGRLQTILGADHQFNLAEDLSSDGYHNLVHMRIPADPVTGALGSLGRLYVNTANGQVNLFYMDDAGTAYQLTPTYISAPQRITGSQSIAAGASANILNVSYDFTGFGIVYINGTNTSSTSNFMRSGSASDAHRADENGSDYPEILFSGTILTVKNRSSSAETIVWSLMVNRI
jgi:hypothetical protein